MLAVNRVSFLGRLPLWQKLALLITAQAVPAVLLGCFYFQQTAAAGRQARSLRPSGLSLGIGKDSMLLS